MSNDSRSERLQNNVGAVDDIQAETVEKTVLAYDEETRSSDGVVPRDVTTQQVSPGHNQSDDDGCSAVDHGSKGSDEGRRSRRTPLIVAACLGIVLGVLCLVFGGRLFSGQDAQMNTYPDTDATSVEYDSKVMTNYELMPDAAVAGTFAEDVEILPIGNGEGYADVIEGAFISTLTRPLSTVSADVDTASYANLRRMLRNGYAPASTMAAPEEAVEYDAYQDYYYGAKTIPAGAVRIEEMLNYFDYDYPAPSDGDRFGMTAQVRDCPWNAQTRLVSLGFASAPDNGSAAKAGRNLVFLVDVSGSMNSPDKLNLLKDAFAVLVGDLGHNDRVSIVTYADGESIVLDGANGTDHDAILSAIRGLQAGGSTNGEAGLEMAYRLAESHFVKGGVNRIVMASDGDLNVGISSTDELYAYVDAKRETGIYLSVLGFGTGNYQDEKMETLADHGNGSYHYIDCVEEAQRVLGSKLSSNTVPFADDVKVQVEFNPAQVKGYRLIGYENRAMADEDFRNDAKDAGDIGPGAQFTVVYEVVPIDSAFEITDFGDESADVPANGFGEGDDAWMRTSLRYRAFEDDAVHEQSLRVDANSAGMTQADQRLQEAIIEFGMLLRKSQHAGSASYEDALARAQESAGVDVAGQRSELCELIELATEF